MTFEADLSLAALQVFASPATLNGSSVDVFIDRAIEVEDEDGNVRQVAALVHAYKATLPSWNVGDRVIAAGGEVALHQTLYDDGFVVRIEGAPVLTGDATLESMAGEADMCAAALDAFAEDATLNSTAVRVLIDRAIELVDEDGNVRHVAALVHAYKSDLPAWVTGDRVIADSGDVKLRQVLFDDGLIVRIEATPVAAVAGDNILESVGGDDMQFVDGTDWEHV